MASAALFIFTTIAAYLISPIRSCPTNCTCSDTYGEMVVACGGEGFTSIPDPTRLPRNTKILNLSHNKITVLDLRVLYELASLERVDISSNEITTIHGSLERFKKLFVIDLSQNKIESIHWKTFGNILAQFNTFKLGGNPFNCDCDPGNSDLCDCNSGNGSYCMCNMKWLQEHVEKYPNLSWDITCQNPVAFRGKPIEDVPTISNRCTRKNHGPGYWVYIVVGALGGLVLLATTVVAIQCRRKLCRCFKTCRKDREDFEETYASNTDTEPLTGRDLPSSTRARMSEDVEEIATGTNGEDAAPRPGQDPEEPGGAVRQEDVGEPYDEQNEQDPVVAEDSIREGPTRHPSGEERVGVNIQHLSVSQRLPSKTANMTVTEQQLNKLAMNLGSGWENLAVHLGLSIDDVDTIKEENRKSNVQKLKMLLAWKAKQKGDATVRNLVRALEAYDDPIDESKFDFFLDETPEKPSNNTQISETSGPRHYQNEDRSAPATGDVYPDSPATFQVNGVKVHFPEGSVEGVRTVSVEVEHPVVRNQRQREILQHGVCGPLITVVQSSGGRFQHPVTVTVDLQYPAGSKQSEPNEDLRWHLLRHTDANGWEDVADFNPHVTDTAIQYKTSEFCRHWLVKLTEHAALPFIDRIEDFIQDFYNPLVVFVMYQGQHGAIVFDCLLKSDPTLKQLVLKSGYNQRVVPMDQTEEVRAKLEGNVAFMGGGSAMTEITFQHPKNVRVDLNKKEVFLSLRDSADPNHRGYISYSIAHRTVTQMPVSITGAGFVPKTTKEVLEFCRWLTSSLGVNFVPLPDQLEEVKRVREIWDWEERNFASQQSCRLSDKAYDLIYNRKRAVCKINWPTNGSGTGFLIGRREIITNYHILQLMRRAFETNRNTEEYKATFHIDDSDHTFHFSTTIHDQPLPSDDSLDYAILELDSEPDQLLIPTLGQYISRITDSTPFAVVAGYPFEGPKKLDFCPMVSIDEKFAIHVKFGNPQAPRPIPDFVSYHSHAMYFGSSGSPGFDPDGNVILLHTKGYFPHYTSQSVIEQGVKLTSIVEDARSKLTSDKFNELFPRFRVEEMEVDMGH
ncbi:uncharacterized protein LOC144928286 [Branchiostoma floridae x Branchiostoma belcheri]